MASCSTSACAKGCSLATRLMLFFHCTEGPAPDDKTMSPLDWDGVKLFVCAVPAETSARRAAA